MNRILERTDEPQRHKGTKRKRFSSTALTFVSLCLCGLFVSAVAARPALAAAKVYDEKADARAELDAAVRRAGAERKRVLVDFGANWCGDCVVLDGVMRAPENLALLTAGYVVVHVDIGRFDKNVDLAERCDVPLKKGVPALAVLDGEGRLIYSQKNGEFEAMRRLDPGLVRAFLEKWLSAAPESPAAGAPAAGDAELSRAIDAAVAGFHGKVGVYVRQLKTGREASLNADETFPTASLIKIPILLTLFERVDRGEVDYNAELVYRSTRAYDDGDVLSSYQDGKKTSPAKLVWLMETMSDNTAALWCAELAGGADAVNAWLDAHGYKTTRVNRRATGRAAEAEKYGWGQTTPREMAELLLSIGAGRAVGPAASEEMLRVLSRTYWDGESLSQIPPTIHAASKQGAVEHSRSEVLLVNAPSGDYVLSVITKDQADASWLRGNEGYELLRRVSRAVWTTFEGTSGWKPRPESVRFYKND